MPPPRPAPTSALPPAPVETNQDVLKPMEANPGSSKASFRSSVASRTFRLSMVAPKPPPSTTLPPRPDEPEYKNHRRSSSGSGINTIAQSTKLETIPASPIPPSKTMNPFPPPVGPLPPTPAVSPPPPSTQPVPPPKRTTSIKQRLRILSAPVPSSNQSQTKLRLSRPQTSDSVTAPPLLMTSPPPTPIAEKITMFQNDPSFLHMHTPVMPSLPPPAALLPLPPDEIAEVTSLSPPPRRGSKQLLETELESPTDILTHALSDKLPTVIEPTNTTMHLALSRPGSAMSNRSHHSQPFLEVDWESPKEETHGKNCHWRNIIHL
ncbi:hypothetical protein BDZ97DRAFT_915773 [Flammula alnicola]|nr:hypothetical protein BDZ97DRAFT_915773 [Flammula alnicola]